MIDLDGRRHQYPNELGRVRISLKNMAICPVEMTYVGDAMAKNKKTGKNNGKNFSKKDSIDEEASVVSQNADKKAIDDIWKHLGLGHIDISYACIGYSLDGRPILNHDDFVNLLVNYGFSINDIVPFIEDFASHSLKDNKSPIVMFTANASAIMTNIEPIK
jgi:hypothetical protein